MDRTAEIGNSKIEGDRSMTQFNWGDYTRHLGFRIMIFAFLGIGWDVLMTFTQQILSGKVTIDALCPASMWMFLAYGTLPLVFDPVEFGVKKLTQSYAVRIFVFLCCFYIFEFCFGS